MVKSVFVTAIIYVVSYTKVFDTKIPTKLSNFHRQILQYWKMIFTQKCSPHGSTLWNSRVITINRKSIFKSDWYEEGILFVNDLLDCNGNLLDYMAPFIADSLNPKHIHVLNC